MNRSSRTLGSRIAAIACGLLFVTGALAAERSAALVGAKVDDPGSLRDLLGNARLLGDLEAETLVLAFVGVDCPVANVSMPKLVQMHQEYAERGAQFVAVYPNRPETIEDMAEHVYDHGVPFLAVKDFGGELAAALGVSRTPTVCVLDEDRVLRYRGRIDDQYSVTSRRAAPRHHDLRDALEAVLAGEEVQRPEVKADGCPLNTEAPAVRVDAVTYHEHVAPIVQERCVGCHRPGQIGPMELLTYDDVVGHAETVTEVVEQRRMPPWHADRRYGHFAENRRLTDDELATILGWHEQGMPEGEPQDGPAAGAADGDDTWLIEPDLIIEMPDVAEVPAAGVLPYQYYVVPTGFEEDRWVKSAQAVAGNSEVVHHVIVYFIAPGRASFYSGDGDIQILAIGGPGEGVLELPDDVALRLPKGSELIFEMHYQPNGIAATDRSIVGIEFAERRPERELRINMFGNEDLDIPPHAQHHAHRASFTFEKDAHIYALLPHMHWRGKSYQAWLETEEGGREILLSVPRYDFNWQTYYRFAEPLTVKAGTTIDSIAHWDNSANNLANPDPSVHVEYGLQTSEEMMYGFLTYTYDETVEDLPAAEPDKLAMLMFNSMDKDKSGLIEPEEMPEAMERELLAEGMQIRTGVTPLLFEAFMQEE